MITRIRNVNTLQFALVSGTVYALLGFVIGVMYGLFFSVIMSAAGSLLMQRGTFSFGWLALIIFPIFYGVVGFIGGVIVAFIYNLVAGWTGGIEVTLTSAPVAPITTTTVNPVM